MKLQAPTSRSTPSDDNLIPMINVVFLLLIFFMVAGTIRPSDPLPIDAPLTLSGAAKTAQPILYLEASGTMILNETPVTADRLAEELMTLLAVSAVEITVDDSLNSATTRSADFPSAPSLAIKADAETPVVLLRQVLEDVRLAGIHTVELVTQQAFERP